MAAWPQLKCPSPRSSRHLVGRLLYDFNTEFETPSPTAEEFAARFRSLLERDDVLVLLSGGLKTPTGFAFLTLRPTPYTEGVLAQLEELYVQPELRDQGMGTALLQTAVLHVRERAEPRCTSTSMRSTPTLAGSTNVMALPMSSQVWTTACCVVTSVNCEHQTVMGQPEPSRHHSRAADPVLVRRPVAKSRLRWVQGLLVAGPGSGWPRAGDWLTSRKWVTRVGVHQLRCGSRGPGRDTVRAASSTVSARP